MLDLRRPDHAYFFGFIHADGHLSENTRNRGRLGIEISIRDEDIIHKFHEIFPSVSTVTYRTRDTNFKDGYESICLNVFDWSFRQELISLGIPVGKKSELIRPPDVPYSLVDYIRGYVDGNGSLGMTSRGFPFISVIICSDAFAQLYLDFIGDVTGVIRSASRNSRDNVYNIAAFKEHAQTIASTLYSDGGLHLDRKFTIYKKMLEWVRPTKMRKQYTSKFWDEKSDTVALSNTPAEAAKLLGRDIRTVKMRLWRLRNASC